MKMLAYAILAGAVWAWVEQPFIFAVAVALGIGGGIGYALRGMNGPYEASGAVPEPLATDPDVDRLVEMGFREEEVRPQLTKARMKGETDPVGYAMRALIR